jgi:hypothetical protein
MKKNAEDGKMKLNRQLANGVWVACGERTNEFIERAAKHANVAINEIIKTLDNAEQVNYGTERNEKIVDADAFARFIEKLEIELILSDDGKYNADQKFHCGWCERCYDSRRKFTNRNYNLKLKI